MVEFQNLNLENRKAGKDAQFPGFLSSRLYAVRINHQSLKRGRRPRRLPWKPTPAHQPHLAGVPPSGGSESGASAPVSGLQAPFCSAPCTPLVRLLEHPTKLKAKLWNRFTRTGDESGTRVKSLHRPPLSSPAIVLALDAKFRGRGRGRCGKSPSRSNWPGAAGSAALQNPEPSACTNRRFCKHLIHSINSN